MIKADLFNELLFEIQKKEKEKQLKIQEDTRLVEEVLDNLYTKVKQASETGSSRPQYAEIHKLLDKEVQENLVMRQGYMLDEVNDKTRIYYNKEDFNNRERTIDKEEKTNEEKEIKRNAKDDVLNWLNNLEDNGFIRIDPSMYKRHRY